MAWDSTRPVPWARLTKEWMVYAAIMVAVFLLFFSSSVSWGSAVGLAVSYPMYLAFGAFLAKMGYQRPTLKQAREQRAAPPPSSSTSTPSRSRPAPTKRTSTGKSQHPRRTRATRR